MSTKTLSIDRTSYYLNSTRAVARATSTLYAAQMRARFSDVCVQWMLKPRVLQRSEGIHFKPLLT